MRVTASFKLFYNGSFTFIQDFYNVTLLFLFFFFFSILHRKIGKLKQRAYMFRSICLFTFQHGIHIYDILITKLDICVLSTFFLGWMCFGTGNVTKPIKKDGVFF